MTTMIFISGILFGAILQYANLNKYNVISGLAIRENYAVAKAIAIAIGAGAIMLNIEIATGLAGYHIKPFILGGLITGGLIFGSGMAILGYCPGTLAVSAGEGSLDAVTGIAGGLTGGLFYTLILPYIKPFLGPNLGKISLNTVTGTNALFFVLLLLTGMVFILLSFWLHKKDNDKSKKWVFSGIALALLNVILFSNNFAGRPAGASTTFPYLSDLLTGTVNNNYFAEIKTAGHWEFIFLIGAFVSGLTISLIKKDFKLTLIHENWKIHKGNSKIKRVLWSFAGGFILITGARMAGGCTSGHILSGGMQLAFGSLFFAIFVFAGLLLTGKFFYKQ